MSHSKKQMHRRRRMVEQALPFKPEEPTQAQLARTHLTIAEKHLSVALAALGRELGECPAQPGLFSAAAELRKQTLELACKRVLQLSEGSAALRVLLKSV